MTYDLSVKTRYYSILSVKMQYLTYSFIQDGKSINNDKQCAPSCG